MDNSYGITFDASNKSFMEAQSIEERLKIELEDLKDNMLSTEKELNNLSNISPVGFNYSKKIEYKDYLDDLIYNWSTIMENANRVREIGDLINKGFTDEIKSFFQSQNDFLKFITDVAQGKQSLGTLFGDNTLSSIDYYEILAAGYTVQGYTEIFSEDGNRVLITAHGRDEDNSRLYIYDKDSGTLETVITFNYSEHVGGISYDSENGIIWIAGDDGKVHSYDYERLNSLISVQKERTTEKVEIDFNISGNSEGIEIPNDIYVKDLLSDSKHKQEGMDSIYYHDGKLYSCTYSATGELVETNLTINRTRKGVAISSESEIVGTLNGATQGLALYEENGKKYVITASSAAFGTPKSRLTKWELTDEGLNPLGYKYIDHTGLEGIEIEEGYVKGVFEQGWRIWNRNQTTEILTATSDINDSADYAVDAMLSIGGKYWDSRNGNT